MNILIDTHILLWFFNGDEKISQGTRNLILSPENEKFVSVSSLWEIAIKFSIGKLTLKNGLQNIFQLIDENGFRLLSLEPAHILLVSSMEFHHRDPFDRLIIAQAIAENMTILTNDMVFRKYLANVVG